MAALRRIALTSSRVGFALVLPALAIVSWAVAIQVERGVAVAACLFATPASLLASISKGDYRGAAGVAGVALAGVLVAALALGPAWSLHAAGALLSFAAAGVGAFTLLRRNWPPARSAITYVTCAHAAITAVAPALIGIGAFREPYMQPAPVSVRLVAATCLLVAASSFIVRRASLATGPLMVAASLMLMSLPLPTFADEQALAGLTLGAGVLASALGLVYLPKPA